MLGSFLRRLPADSCMALHDIPREDRLWDLRNHLLAAIADRLSVNNWLSGQMLVAWADKGAENPVPKPEPIPRPGVAAQPKRRGMNAVVEALGASAQRHI